MAYLKNKFSQELNKDNYLSNCYNHLTRLKIFHFILLIYEMFLNLLYEVQTFAKGFQIQNVPNSNSNLGVGNFGNLSSLIKFVLSLFLIPIFDSIYIFLKLKKFQQYYISITILIDILESISFRSFILLFFIFFFSLTEIYFVVGCFLLIPHIFIIINNFMYNHLYYFVPVFIDYPYDELSSSYDIILLLTKLLLSISVTTSISGLGQLCFFIVFLEQIFFSLYFINILKNHSYLFMKNSFLNRTRVSLFFTKTTILVVAFIFGKTEIMSVLFLMTAFCIFIIFIAYMHFIYNPYTYIQVKRETPMENLFFYLFILSEKNDYDFFFENKIKQHYELCGICDLCQKFKKYKKKYKSYIENDEKEKLINEENCIKNVEDNNKERPIDLFDIVYDNKNKYFELVKKIVINYKTRGKDSLNNNSYYFINLSYLIYFDFKQKNKTLSLNERLILEVLNKENRAFLDNHEPQIGQLLLCNNFIDLSNQILNQLKEIISSEANFIRVKKLIDLSYLLKKMQNKKFKEHLFSRKLENISNSRHLILICSIIYEEIFNTTINNSQMPLRDNIQSFEDVFSNNSYKINRIISLAFDIINKSCIIIRAGKEIYSYINNNLFDLFPLVFKEYQINLFMSSIFEKYEKKNNNKEKMNSNLNSKIDKKETRISLKNIKSFIKTKNNKKETIEIKLIISENYSSKMYYKLLTLKLTPLFTNNTHNFILFDGIFLLHKHTLITLQDFENNIKAKEILIGVSEPQLEKSNDAYSIPFKKYISLQNNEGFISTKVSSFYLSVKLYNIYILTKKGKESQITKKDRKSSQLLETRLDDENNNDEEIETNSNHKNTKFDKLQLIEDTASATSAQTGSSYSGGISNIGIRNKKKDNIYDYAGFNKIKKLNFLTIFISIILLIFEFFYLRTLESNSLNNNTSLLLYREFTKLYFQFFSSILAVTCIYADEDNNCIRLVDIFTIEYFGSEENENFFNFTLYVMIQNEILARDILEKRNSFVSIHKIIGTEKYNELFNQNIDYLRVTQNMHN